MTLSLRFHEHCVFCACCKPYANKDEIHTYILLAADTSIKGWCAEHAVRLSRRLCRLTWGEVLKHPNVCKSTVVGAGCLQCESIYSIHAYDLNISKNTNVSSMNTAVTANHFFPGHVVKCIYREASFAVYPKLEASKV